MQVITADDVYDAVIGEANPHSCLGLLSIIHYFSGVHTVVRTMNTAASLRADSAVRPATKDVDPAGACVPNENIRTENHSILLRIKDLIEELTKTQAQ